MTVPEELLEKLRCSNNIVALTGAGVSAASGVPTFRGENGLWKKFRPEELANFATFSKNPAIVWEWYRWRRNLIQEVKPNSAHYSLVEFEKMFANFDLITQNVDNLHQRSGSKKIIELHGNIMRNKCSRCNKLFKEEFDLNKGIPTCSYCEALIRPDVVWFGELLPPFAIEKAQEVTARCEVFFSIGTSSVVEPAASLPYIAKVNGAFLVEINTEETPLTPSVDILLRDSAKDILPQLVTKLKEY